MFACSESDGTANNINSCRIVSALRKSQWGQIGHAYDDNGNIKMLEGMGWQP